MAYSPDADRFLLVFPGNASFEESWLYDPAADTWSHVPSGTTAPPAVYQASLVYDPAVRKFVFFGGLSGAMPSLPYYGNGGTWLFDPTTQTWGNVAPAVAPKPRFGAAMTFVPTLGQVLLFGGDVETLNPSSPGGGIQYTVNDSWLYDAAANAWTNVTPTVSPSWNSGPYLWSEPGSRSVYLLPQIDWAPWAFDPIAHTWRELPMNANGPLVDLAAVAYDVATRSVVLFSGGFNDLENTTWWFNVTRRSWIALPSAGAPAPREMAEMAYDSRRGNLVLYGGRDGNVTYTDTWLYLPPPPLGATIDPSASVGDAPLVPTFQARAGGGFPPYTFLWDFGDGSSDSGAFVGHLYGTAGNYTIRLTVTDSTGDTTTSFAGMQVRPVNPATIPSPLSARIPAAVEIVGVVAAMTAVATYGLFEWRKSRPR